MRSQMEEKGKEKALLRAFKFTGKQNLVLKIVIFWFLHYLQFYQINITAFANVGLVKTKRYVDLWLNCIESVSWWNRILINIFWKTALLDLIQPATSLCYLMIMILRQVPTNANSAKRWFQQEKRWNLKHNGMHHCKNEWNECICILSAGYRWKSCLQGSLHCFLIPGTLTLNTHLEILLLLT